MSFGQKEVFVDLDTKNTRAIMGRNEDIGETGNSANGVGKTTIFNAIIFALYGKGIDKLKTDEYINIVNGKKLVVELCFEKGDKTYTIRRGRKPNFLEMTEDNTSITLDAMRNTDEAISSLVGYSYDLFMSSFFLSPHRQSFMAMSAPEQRAMIESMLSLDVLAERASSLKIIRDEISVDKKILERDLVRYEQSNQNVKTTHDRLMRSSEKFEEDRTACLKSLDVRLKSLKEIDLVELREIFEEYLEKKETLKTVSAAAKALHSDKKALERHLEDAIRASDEYQTVVKKFKKFEQDSKETTKDAREFIESHDALASCRGKLERAEQAIDLYNKTKTEKTQCATELSYTARDLRVLTEKIDRLKTEVAGHESGKCHVCGGDYVDADHLEAIKKELFESSVLHADQTKAAQSLEEKSQALDELLDSIEVLDSSEVNQLRKTIQTLEKCLQTVKNSESVENPYKEIMESIEVLSKQEFEELQQKVDEAERRFKEAEEKMSELSDILEGYEDILSELRVSKKEHIDAMEDEISKIESDISRKLEEPNDFAVEAQNVMSGYVDLSSIEEDLRKIEAKEKHVGYLIKLLTDSKSFIRRRILDNYVPYLNKKINEYSEKLGLPHVCEVDSDLSVNLSYMSRSVSYYNLSRGERLRLDMATTGAFRDVMEMLGKGCNLALLDEVLDSALDASGIHAALKFICSSAETVLLVTHREELSAGISDKIVVIKRNGFSDIM